MSEQNFFDEFDDEELDAITSEGDDLISQLTAGDEGWMPMEEPELPEVQSRRSSGGGSRLVSGTPPRKKGGGGRKALIAILIVLLILIAALAAAFWKLNGGGTDLSALMFWKQQEETQTPTTESLTPATESLTPTTESVAPVTESVSPETAEPVEETEPAVTDSETAEAPQVSPDSNGTTVSTSSSDVPLLQVLPSGFASGLTTVNYYGAEQADAQVSVDSSIVEPLGKLMKAAREAGYTELLLHSFTAVDSDPDEEVAEHETGLCVDFITTQNSYVREFETAAPEVSAWLQEHAYEYGFILRFPEDKTEITGVSYQPWHYSYVGVTVATDMKENDWCLEEYLAR